MCETIKRAFVACLAIADFCASADTSVPWPSPDTELNDVDPRIPFGRYVQYEASNTVTEIIKLTNGVITIGGHSVNIDFTSSNTQLVSTIEETVSVPDFTTNNMQLVATIEATAPAPGNYSAVSNAAMNARNATDIGVRGFPRLAGSFFTVNDEVCIFDEGEGGWTSQNFLITGYPNDYAFQLKGDYNQFLFVLSDNYSAIITNNPGYVIIGYTNTLAQVSQIPVLPSGIVTTNSSGVVGANLAVNGTLYVSIDDSPDFSVATNTGVRIFNQGTISITDGGLERGLSISADRMFMVDTSHYVYYDYVFPQKSGTFALDVDLVQKQDALPYPTNAIPYSAITNVPIIKTDSITDGTNTIDAAGNVWNGEYASWVLNGDTLVWNSSLHAWTNDNKYIEYDARYKYLAYIEDGYGLIAEAEAVEENALSAELVYVEGAGEGVLGIATRESVYKLSGKLALTNDIPTVTEPDYTTNNAQLVATIKAELPPQDILTDGTNTIDAARNVYSVGYTNTVWIWRGATDYGQPIWKKTDESDFYFWFLESVLLEPTSEFPNGQNATNLVFEIDDVFVSCYRDTFTVTNYVGKLALTNDLDYTTSNTQLVATIEATAPVPGNYAAVSNAAMNSRRMTDLNVYSEFTEDTWVFYPIPPRYSIVMYGFNQDSGGNGAWQIFIKGGDGDYQDGEMYPIDGDGNEKTLQLYFEGYHVTATNIPAHTPFPTGDMLAQVSQIPDTSLFMSSTGGVFQTAGGGQTFVRVRGSFMQGCSTVNAIGVCSHAEGTNTVANGSHSHAEGYGSNTTGYGEYGHAEGVNSSVKGTGSHAEGGGTVASNTYSHAEGYHTLSGGAHSHAEGSYTKTIGKASKSMGVNSKSLDAYAFTWSGVETNNNDETTWYASHGVGTFNVNPVGGVEGFYIGKMKMRETMGYVMYTPLQTGDWQFRGSGVQIGHEYTIEKTDYEYSSIVVLKDNGTQISQAEIGLGVSVEYIDFSNQGVPDVEITATRAYSLQDRSVNTLSAQSAVPFEFPSPIENASRDFKLRLVLTQDLSGSDKFTFVGATTNGAHEAISFETENGTFPSVTTISTNLYHFVETAPSTFYVEKKQLAPTASP